MLSLLQIAQITLIQYGWHPWLFIPRVQSNVIFVVLSKMSEMRRDAIHTKLLPVIDKKKTHITRQKHEFADLFIHELLELHEFYGWHPWLFIARVQSNAISTVHCKKLEIKRVAIFTGC